MKPSDIVKVFLWGHARFGEGEVSRLLVAFAATAVLVACAQPIKQVWIRIDGQPIIATPANMQQFEIDQTICGGRTQAANLSGTQYCRGIADCIVQGEQRGQGMGAVAKGCMAERGYMQVPEPEAETRAAAFRSTATARNHTPIPATNTVSQSPRR